MRKQVSYKIGSNEIVSLKEALLDLSKQSNRFCYLDNNFHQSQPHSFECLVAMDSLEEIKPNSDFEALKEFYSSKKDWLFGGFGYDMKNKVEALFSSNF